MSIHFPEVFHEFLDSLAFSPHCSDAQPIASLWKDTPCTTHNGTDGIKRSVSIYQAQTTKLTIIAFRQKIVSILREQAHVATDSVADAILGLTVKAATNGKERADYLGAFLKALKCVDVSHFIVLPAKAGNKPLTFDGYTLGSLNTSVLVSRCNRAGSDYAELYSNGLTGQFTIQSPEFKHVVHDYSHEAANLSNVSGVVWENLRLNYFERISRLHCEFMYSDLDRKQSLGATFGAHMLDVPNIRSSVGRFAESITIYLGFAGKGVGYVVPERGTVTVVQPGPESEAFKQFTEHREKYRLSEIGDSELGRTLFACAGFCQQAVRFLEAERPNDAALYATVCLEHLFSEKQSTSEFVCSRAAVVTHLRLSSSFGNAKKEMTRLYGARSAFVHSGKSVASLDAERLIAYARETIRSMLVLHFDPKNRRPGFLAQWVGKLDFIVAGIAAGQPVDAALLAECGIFGP